MAHGALVARLNKRFLTCINEGAGLSGHKWPAASEIFPPTQERIEPHGGRICP
jgi:hypothetical protein